MKKKHSPLRLNPLRSPGQSLSERIQDIIYDDIHPYIVVSFLVIIIAGIQWLEQSFKILPSPIFWTFIAIVFVGYSVVKIIGANRRIRNMRLGLDGERVVGQSLERMREMGYQVFHDMIDIERGFNIDHVLVGPAGVFTIETKTISKSSGVQKIECDDRSIRYDGHIPDRNPLFQAKFQARWLQDFLLETIGVEILVKPVIIFPGWFVESHMSGSDIWVLNEKGLPKFLENAGIALGEDEIRVISAQIARYNREKHMEE